MPSVPQTSPTVGDVSDKGLDCRFCGRGQAGARKLIAGPGVYICDACVGVAEGVISSSGILPGRLGRGGFPETIYLGGRQYP